jgi:hypothetical protein
MQNLAYTQQELDKIKKLKEANDSLEEYFTKRRIDWSKDLEPLFSVIRFEFNNSNVNKILESQALALSYRQQISEEVSQFLDRRTKQDVKLKRIKQDKFIFYATSFGVKTNTTEKSIMIEAHVSEESRNIELIDNYVEFLRASGKTLESLQYTIKNIIELLNYLK